MPVSSEQAAQWLYPSATESNIKIIKNIPSPQSLMNTRMARVAKADSKLRGCMTAYASFVQICREENKRKHLDENNVFAKFSKKCAER